MVFGAILQIDLDEFQSDIRFTAEAEVVVLFGPSGSGKSMTLKAIAGLVRPREGHVILNGTTLFDSEKGINLPPQDRHVGYMPQDYALFPNHTVADNIAYGLHGLSKEEIHQRVHEQLTLMNLSSEANRWPSEISGGQRQRTALARALATRPSLLLMDEPFAAVEEPLRDILRAELMRIHKKFEIPVILVTHDLAQALTLANQLIVIENGISVQSGPSEEVYRSPSHPSVASLLGMSNIMRGTIVENRESSAIAKIDGSDLMLEIPTRKQPGSEVLLGFHPEAITLLSVASEDTKSNALEGKVLEARTLGIDHSVSFEIGTEQVEVRLTHRDYRELDIRPGHRLIASIRPTDIHIFPKAKD